LYRTSVQTVLSVPTTTSPKFIDAIDNAVAFTPVPLSVTVVVGLLAVVLMVSVSAGCVPKAIGLRVRPMAQLAPAANAPGLAHVVDGDPAMAYGPPAVTLSELIVMAAVPVFLRVTVLGALVVLTTTLPKFSAVAETVVCATAKAVENRQNIAINDIVTT